MQITKSKYAHYWIGAKLLLLFYLLVCSPLVFAYDTTTGNISRDTVWDSGVIVIIKKVLVKKGVTLTIKPGTVIKGGRVARLVVEGTLHAEGNNSSPIIFTSLKDDSVGGDTNGDGNKSVPKKRDWSGITLQGKSKHNTLKHIVVNYAGSPSRINQPYKNFSAAIISYTSDADLQNLKIEKNYGPAILLSSNAMGIRISNVVLRDNFINGIEIGKLSVEKDIRLSSDLTYFIHKGIEIDKSSVLYVPQGTVVKFGTGSKIYVKGTMISDGSPNAPVVFTSIYDDSVGSILDIKNKRLPKEGDWHGFVFQKSSDSSILSNVHIKYAGRPSKSGRNAVITAQTSRALIKGVKITDSGKARMYYNNNPPIIRKMTIDEKNQNPFFPCEVESVSLDNVFKSSGCIDKLKRKAYLTVAEAYLRNQTAMLKTAMEKALTENELNRRIIDSALIFLEGYFTIKNFNIDDPEDAIKIFEMTWDVPLIMLNNLPTGNNKEKERSAEIAHETLDLIKFGVVLTATAYKLANIKSELGKKIAKDTAKITQDIITIWKLDNIIEKLNQIAIVQEYLYVYTNKGGHQPEVARHFGLSPNSTVEKTIPAIAEKLSIKKRLFGVEYKKKKTLELLSMSKKQLLQRTTWSWAAYCCDE